MAVVGFVISKNSSSSEVVFQRSLSPVYNIKPMRTAMTPEHKYDAFISYQCSDGAPVVRWLRHELVPFRARRRLWRTYGRKPNVYVDTAYKRGAGEFYEQGVGSELLSSVYPFVVATPASAQRGESDADWTARAIVDFAASPNESAIRPVAATSRSG